MSEPIDYKSPYKKTKYTGTIKVRNADTGEIEDKIITRTVYINMEIDPDLEIPAGTKIGNEIVSENTTNLERMKAGKSPVIKTTDENGDTVYDRIELHHLTSEERNRSSLFFNGEDKEGALVEIQSSKHSKYKKQLHAINEPNNSFRKRTDTIVSEDGTISRQKVKTTDAEQYERFRPQYWKDRAAEIEQQRTNTGGETMDRWVDKSPEERQKILQSQKDAADKWNANHSGKKNSSEDEGKGQRERTPDHSNDKGQSR